MSQAAAEFRQIPVIDVSPLAGTDDAAIRRVAGAIRAAAIDVGFFYVAGHGVPRDLLRAVHLAAKYFFLLPVDTKRTIQVNRAHRGYVPFAQTTQPGRKRADLKESFNFAYPFSPADLTDLAGRALIGSNQWPPGEAVWRGVIEDYYREVFELGQRILEGFAIALDIERDFFRGRYRRPLVRARLLHYPPQYEGTDAGQFGAAEHTDYGTITILWQDDAGGLQVKNRAGQWIDAPTLEDAFVINIGDMLARWSNDVFVSTPHRVINTSGRERFSIPVFYDPDYDTVVECLPNCASSANPPRYPPIVAGEYITSRYDGTYSYRQSSPAAT
ncbi:MAG: 2-oxoglutarate and iron-dependent oxygenase domain-containing protein [Casimicrobiaceae bacterium]